MSQENTNQVDEQTGMDKFFATLRGIDMRRRSDDRWIGGVCSGLADRLGVDPVIVRAGLVVLSLLGGMGITLYLLGWALIPNDRNEIVAERAVRDGDGGSIVVVAFAALGLLGGTAFSGPWWMEHQGWGFPWGAVLVGLLIWWLVKRSGPQADADQRVSSYQSGTAVSTRPSPPSAAPPSAAGSPRTAQTTSGPPTTEPRPVVPKSPRRQTGGPLMALLAIGLALATYGSLVWAGDVFGWTGDTQSIALAGSLASMGLLLLGLGIAGWRAGFVAFLTIVLAIATWSSTIVPRGLDVSGPVGDVTWAPTSASAGATQDYRLAVGSGVLDLASLPTEGVTQPGAPTPQVPVYVGMGELVVRVPPGLTVRVDGHVGLGEIVLPGESEGDGRGGPDLSESTVVGEGPAEVIVDAEVGLGSLRIVKE